MAQKKIGAKKKETARRLAATQISDYRKGRTGLLPLQSGRVFLVRRPAPLIAIKASRLPQNYLNAAAGVKTAAEGMKVLAGLTEEEFNAYTKYATEVVCHICLDPKVQEGGGNDALDPGELEPADFNELFGWAIVGGETWPVETEEGGGLTVEELETFRNNGQLPSLEPGGTEVQQEPVNAPGHP